MRFTLLQRRASVVALAVTLTAIAVIAVAYGLFVILRAPGVAPVERVAVRPIAPQSPRPSPQPAPIAKSAERADLKPDPRTSLEPYTIAAPFQIDDGLTFGPEKAVRTRLSGLTGPGRDAVCRDGDDRLWACGLQARAALNNLISKRQVRCTPTGPSDSVVPARCDADGVDLGRRLVELGYARSEVDHRAEMDRARTSNAGMWNGGWRLR